MRVAFVDLMFSWPPRGGAPVDLYEVAAGLQARGHAIKLFYAENRDNLAQGSVDSDRLPFPAQALAFDDRTFTPAAVPARFRAAVEAWQPDAVFIGLGFFLKPAVIEALSDFPCIGRYYAYEAACPRDFRLYKDGRTCPNNYLRTPDPCRRCTVEGLASSIRSGRPDAYTREYLRTHAYAPGYHRRLVSALRALRAVIVSNDLARSHFDGFHGSVRVVPGGVHVTAFDAEPPAAGPETPVVLMPGRADDPSKGIDTLLRAGDILAGSRGGFEIRVTHSDCGRQAPWLRPVGWVDRSDMPRLYAESHICVVPSLWDEPFGLVALEAMASARPVCAARVGGLRDIVRPGETGFLHDPHRADHLAENLARLLDDPGLRSAMGAAGRVRAEAEYDWDRVVDLHYVPLLRELVP